MTQKYMNQKKSSKPSRPAVFGFIQKRIQEGGPLLGRPTFTPFIGDSTLSSIPATCSFHFDHRWNMKNLFETLQHFIIRDNEGKILRTLIDAKLFIIIIAYHLLIHQIAYCEWIGDKPSKNTSENEDRVVHLLASSINAYYQPLGLKQVYSLGKKRIQHENKKSKTSKKETNPKYEGNIKYGPTVVQEVKRYLNTIQNFTKKDTYLAKFEGNPYILYMSKMQFIERHQVSHEFKSTIRTNDAFDGMFLFDPDPSSDERWVSYPSTSPNLTIFNAPTNTENTIVLNNEAVWKDAQQDNYFIELFIGRAALAVIYTNTKCTCKRECGCDKFKGTAQILPYVDGGLWRCRLPEDTIFVALTAFKYSDTRGTSPRHWGYKLTEKTDMKGNGRKK